MFQLTAEANYESWLQHQLKTVLLTEDEKNQLKKEVEVLESAGFTTKKNKTERGAGL